VTRGPLLGWVKDDADYLARQISAIPPTQAPMNEHAAISLRSSR